MLLIGGLFGGRVYALEPPPLQLFGRATIDDYSVDLSEPDWSWLRQKGQLLLGVSAPDYGPFEVTANGQGFEGITADYAGLLSQLLHVKIEVRRYDSRAQVIQALKDGEVDLLGTANDYEVPDRELATSTAYAEDQPILVTRSGEGETLPADLAGKKVAMLYHYLPPQVVSAFYPHAELRLYPSTLSAIGAVAFGQADVYLGDSISASYLINKNYLNNVQLADFSRLETGDFYFALARHNKQLLRIVNAALAVIPPKERLSILRRWKASSIHIPGLDRLHFSDSEQRWLDRHPRLKVAINEHLVPLSYFNEKGELRGITADVLAQISLRTGLKFDVQRGDSPDDLIQAVRSGKADILAAVSPSSERARDLDFSRPYLTTPFVLVSSVGENQPSTLDDMAGKTLALVRGCVLYECITADYPNIRIIAANSSADALDMVTQGKVDAAVTTFISARYLIASTYRDKLRITSTVGTVPAQIAFGTTPGDRELDSILNKVLLSIAPEDMDDLINRWRSDMVVNDSYWLRNRMIIMQGFALAAVLLLIAFLWIAYLRQLINRRMRAEQALSDQLEFMRVLIDGTPHPIYVRDREGRLLICNPGYLDIYGAGREEMRGKTLIEALSNCTDEALDYHRDALEVMQQGLPRALDRPMTLADGRVLMIYHWMLPYRGSDGKVMGMIGGWIDISERQLLIEQLQEAKREADDANRAKTTFLATMSHEIRTPMNAVIGMLELSMRKADQGLIDRIAIEVASGAAQDLLHLIGDILDVARIESGKLSLLPTRANLRELVVSVVRMLDGLARHKQVSLVMDVGTEANCEVMIDPLRFKQILSNVLSNSIKFTEKGEVRVTLQVIDTQVTDELAFSLCIQDTGIGISQADQQRLFSPFTQARNNTQSARTGSGLGLMISRTLCEMMGGKLHLSSELGKGTQVELGLVLPLLEPLYLEPSLISEMALPDQVLNILVVDDYSANRVLLSQQLSYLGHRVRDAEDGVQGLRDWKNSQFDVVITDCHMPNMNGYELTRAIRELELAEGRQLCRILGFTANAQSEEKELCREAGMDDCLFKPISLQDLNDCLIGVEAWQQQVFEGGSVTGADDYDLINLTQLTHGDEAMIKRLLDDLASSLQTDLDQLLKLFVEHNLTALADLAHRVKGGARIIKAHGLIACCERLEAACAQGDEDGLLIPALDELQQSMERMVVVLCEYDVVDPQ